ncbi:hypothetical protein BH24ACT15_BH24ACT15_02460 [soil metagenome]
MRVEPRQRTIAGVGVVHDRHRVVRTDAHAVSPPAGLGSVPMGGNRVLCVRGLKIRKNGWASVPVPAAHCQPPLLLAMSPSTRWRRKCASPWRQSLSRSLHKNEATIMRARLCIHPCVSSWPDPTGSIVIPACDSRPIPWSCRRVCTAVSRALHRACGQQRCGRSPLPPLLRSEARPRWRPRSGQPSDYPDPTTNLPDPQVRGASTRCGRVTCGQSSAGEGQGRTDTTVDVPRRRRTRQDGR